MVVFQEYGSNVGFTHDWILDNRSDLIITKCTDDCLYIVGFVLLTIQSNNHRKPKKIVHEPFRTYMFCS